MSRELESVGGGLTAAVVKILDASKARFELVDGEIARRSNGRKIVFVVFRHMTQENLAEIETMRRGKRLGWMRKI